MGRLTTFLVALLQLLGSGSAVAQTELRINASHWPPYFIDGGGGFVRELLDMCLPVQGYVPQYYDLDVARASTALQKGLLDIGVFSYKEYRTGYLEYSDLPLFRDGYRPFALTSRGLTVDSLADYESLRLGHLKGLRYSDEYLDVVRSSRESGRVEEATTNDELLALLLNRRVDVFVSLESTTLWMANNQGTSDRIETLNHEVKSGEYFIVAAKASPRIDSEVEFLKGIESCLEKLSEEGGYQSMKDRYGLR